MASREGADPTVPEDAELSEEDLDAIAGGVVNFVSGGTGGNGGNGSTGRGA